MPITHSQTGPATYCELAFDIKSDFIHVLQYVARLFTFMWPLLIAIVIAYSSERLLFIRVLGSKNLTLIRSTRGEGFIW